MMLECLTSDSHFKVGHEPLHPTVGTTMFGRRVLYLPGFFTYGEWGLWVCSYTVPCREQLTGNIYIFFFSPAQYIVKVDGKTGLFRGLSPRLFSSAISTVVRGKLKQVSEDEYLYMWLTSTKRVASVTIRYFVLSTSHHIRGECNYCLFLNPNCILNVTIDRCSPSPDLSGLWTCFYFITQQIHYKVDNMMPSAKASSNFPLPINSWC